MLAALALLSVLFGSGCGTTRRDYSKDYLLFQDADSLKRVRITQRDYLLQKGDALQIAMTSASTNQEQLAPFNALLQSNGGENAGVLPNFTLNEAGQVQLPLIGKVRLEGLTLKAAQDTLETYFAEFVSSPGVSLQLINFSVTVLGDVRSPGRKIMPSAHATLFDALAAAGDLSPTANRRDILLIRQNEEGVGEFVRLDLTQTASLMQQDYFQLAQNDVLYIAPNKQKINDTMRDEQAQFRRIQYYLTFISAATWIVNLITTLF